MSRILFPDYYVATIEDDIVEPMYIYTLRAKKFGGFEGFLVIFGWQDSYNISLREREILALLIQDYKNKQIGETLYISANTVKTRIQNIYAKLDVKNRHELLIL
jgi:DNA-binding CsgD family transcriptional regulator